MPQSKPPRKRTPAKKSTKADQNDIMADLDRAYSECYSMLSETAKFAPYLTTKELVEAGDVEQTHDNSKILSRDTIQMRSELDAIRADTPKKINSNNPNHLVRGLSIGDRYQEWQEKYQRAILPTLERLGDLLKDAAGNLDATKQEEKVDDNA